MMIMILVLLLHKNGGIDYDIDDTNNKNIRIIIHLSSGKHVVFFIIIITVHRRQMFEWPAERVRGRGRLTNGCLQGAHPRPPRPPVDHTHRTTARRRPLSIRPPPTPSRLHAPTPKGNEQKMRRTDSSVRSLPRIGGWRFSR